VPTPPSCHVPFQISIVTPYFCRPVVVFADPPDFPVRTIFQTAAWLKKLVLGNLDVALCLTRCTSMFPELSHSSLTYPRDFPSSLSCHFSLCLSLSNKAMSSPSIVVRQIPACFYSRSTANGSPGQKYENWIVWMGQIHASPPSTYSPCRSSPSGWLRCLPASQRP
jgi:hypothetical protein